MGRILCIGDSNTYGYDPHFYFGDCYGLVCFKMPVGMSLLLRQLNNPKECRINNLILCRFCCAAAKTWQIITSAIPTFQKDLRLFNCRSNNCGQNGREIPKWESQFSAYAQMVREELPLALVTVMLGSNDLLQSSRFTAEDVTRRMEVFLSYLIGVLPNIRFLLIAPPSMQSGEWVREKRLLTESAWLGGCYADLATRLGIAFVDAGGWSVGLCYDGVHFTTEGHRAFAVGVDRLLNSLDYSDKGKTGRL